MSKLYDMIAKQQKGHEDEPRFMIGEQLKEIAERELLSAELLERDLESEEMNLEAAEEHFQEYADENRGGAKAFCITPNVAERLLREFYGLPIPKENASEKKEAKAAADLEEAKKRADAAEANAIAAQLAAEQAQERFEEAQKKLKTASPEVSAFKALFDSMQGTAAKLRTMIEKIRAEDSETADKLAAALKAFGSKL